MPVTAMVLVRLRQRALFLHIKTNLNRRGGGLATTEKSEQG